MPSRRGLPDAQLLKVQFNGAKPTRIDLIFSYELVTVEGRNLEVLLTGLRSRTLAVIEQFNPATHGEPEKDALVVESIESITENLSTSVSKDRKSTRLNSSHLGISYA